jgi:hypothetical protein
MQLILHYDPRQDVWTLHAQGVSLRTARDAAAFRAALVDAAKSLGNERDFVLMDVQDMDVDMAMKDAYGEAMRNVLEPRVRDVLRYGRPAGFTPTVMMLEAQGFSLNLYADRAAALQALARLREPRRSAAQM